MDPGQRAEDDRKARRLRTLVRDSLLPHGPGEKGQRLPGPGGPVEAPQGLIAARDGVGGDFLCTACLSTKAQNHQEKAQRHVEIGRFLVCFQSYFLNFL